MHDETGCPAVREALEAVNGYERRELRKSSPAEKFRQLEALMQSATAVGWDGEEMIDEREARG